MKEQKVYVAIVTYNRKEYLLNLLEALQQSEKKISGILLLDNKSTDGTNQTLMEIGFTEKDDIGVLHENILFPKYGKCRRGRWICKIV